MPARRESPRHWACPSRRRATVARSAIHRSNLWQLHASSRGRIRTKASPARVVTARMRDLKSFYVRANTCVACHQNLDSDIVKAGHPELTFELDGQSVAEPKHWRDDDPSSGVRAWLVGQSVALREMSWELSKNETPTAETAKWKGLEWLLAEAT